MEHRKSDVCRLTPHLSFLSYAGLSYVRSRTDFMTTTTNSLLRVSNIKRTLKSLNVLTEMKELSSTREITNCVATL
jgi:hypothetical protein